ncbi:MAG: enoyl-CoA hydratase/isomerase family protein [Thermoanaerobaculia bacterium]|nr:enoyl-CoA hydratase/isomerase family protein [Thermoanaerobaculia bacterium]
MSGASAFVKLEVRERVATITLSRGKVNALILPLVEELRGTLEQLEADGRSDALVLTGNGPFFSFGFDIPELFPLGREEFAHYLTRFTDLYRYLFTFPKPVIAALNGHAIAGGCMIALACDHRLMVSGNARISLNEITFGSTVFAGATEMLRFWVGDRIAQRVLYSGTLYSAAEGVDLGLVDQAVSPGQFESAVDEAAQQFAGKALPAFASTKQLLRRNAAEEISRQERESIARFVDIWYSPETREKLQKITIRDR